MTIKSRFFSIALLAALAITATVSTLDATSEAVQAANVGAPATPVLLAQYNPCSGTRCR